jgi:hypothetical protein
MLASMKRPPKLADLFLAWAADDAVRLHSSLLEATINDMGKTIRTQQSIYLDDDRAELLDTLSASTRIAKQVLLREAVDDLLVKHKLLKPPRGKVKK